MAPGMHGKVAPIRLWNADTMSGRGGQDSRPSTVALHVADPCDLVESRNGVTHMGRVLQGLLALCWKGECMRIERVALS